MVVITKIDICPPQVLQNTIIQITKVLKSPGARKIPIFIKNREEAVNTATQFVSSRICPIFQVSNVTGESLDLVRMFFNILPHYGYYDTEAPFEFHVNDTFSVPYVGTVVSGIIKSGVIHAGDPILIGPDSLGQFTQTHIRTIERKRIGVPLCSAGQSASFALKKVRRKDVRKGMVVLPRTEKHPEVHRDFVAEGTVIPRFSSVPLSVDVQNTRCIQEAPVPTISHNICLHLPLVLILSHATTIREKYQAMLHVGSVSQTCSIIDIDRAFVRTGDRAVVAFRFVQRPEYITAGDRILFREGRTKGLGIVKSLGYDFNHPLRPKPVEEDGKNGTAQENGTVVESK